jgi:hypothetical protein
MYNQAHITVWVGTHLQLGGLRVEAVINRETLEFATEAHNVRSRGERGHGMCVAARGVAIAYGYHDHAHL